MLIIPNTDFSNISWNWLCYQRAFSAIYKKCFWKMTLFADAILLQIWLYTYMLSLVWIVWKTNEILHIVQSVAFGVCFSIHHCYTCIHAIVNNETILLVYESNFMSYTEQKTIIFIHLFNQLSNCHWFNCVGKLSDTS